MSFVSPKTEALKPPGILKEGFLTKKGQNYKTWRKRYFIVLDGHILYFKDKDDLFHPLGIIYLQESFLDREPFYDKKDNTFVIRSQGKRFMLSAESTEEKENWVRILERTINQTAMRAKMQQTPGAQLVATPTTSSTVANISASVPTTSVVGSSVPSGDGMLNDNLAEELQKERESSLKLLQTLNAIDKPMGLLLSGVETMNNLIVQNEYVSDSELEKKKLQKKMEKRKSKKIEISDSDSSDQESSDDELASAKKGGDEEDLRTFTLSTYFVPNRGTSGSRILSNPSDRLSQMKEDLETASESCEKVKEKYVKQIQLYKDKVRIRKNLPKWSLSLKEIKEQQKHVQKEFDIMQKYMATSLDDATKHLKSICVGIQRSTVVLTSPRGAGTEVHESVFDPEKDQYRIELEQMREENRRLLEEVKAAKERDEQNNKAIQELQHHKKLLIKEVKNLRTGKK